MMYYYLQSSEVGIALQSCPGWGEKANSLKPQIDHSIDVGLDLG